jgi:hypothetical protein
MKYSERLAYIESISLDSQNDSVSQDDYIHTVNKSTLKVLLKSSSELLTSSKKKINESTLNSEENIEKLHEDLSELRSMYNSLCTVLLTSCAFYMNIKKDVDGNEFQSYNDHWELIPTISNVLCTLLMDVIYNEEFILYNNPFAESEKEAIYKTYIMKLLTWGLNTRVFMEHPERIEGYESKVWGEPMTDEEREELWNMNWKKTIKKETKTLFDVMNEQKNEVELCKQVETKKRKEEELRTIRRSKWSDKTDELDWKNFRK